MGRRFAPTSAILLMGKNLFRANFEIFFFFFFFTLKKPPNNFECISVFFFKYSKNSAVIFIKFSFRVSKTVIFKRNVLGLIKESTPLHPYVRIYVLLTTFSFCPLNSACTTTCVVRRPPHVTFHPHNSPTFLSAPLKLHHHANPS